MTILFANNASAPIASTISATDTTITLSTGQGAKFPSPGAGDYFYATLVDSSNNLEIIKVTGRSVDTLTVQRGKDGTTGRIYPAGSILELRMVAAALADFQAGLARPTIFGIKESGTIAALGANGTINFDFLTQSILYYTANATGNWVLNVRGDGSNTLDSLLSVGQFITLTHMVTMGTSLFNLSSVQVDGSAVSTYWPNGASASGYASAINIYSIVIAKTGAGAFKALVSMTPFV